MDGGNRLLRWLCILAVLTLLLWGLTDVRRRAETDPARIGAHSTDFTVYTEAGAAFFDGRDPYAVTNVRGWHYLYPPLFALLVAPLHPLPTAWQGVIWYVLSLLMAAGCLFECRTILMKLPETGHPSASWQETQRWAVLGAFLGLFFPILDTMQRGQVGLAVLYPLLLGFRLTLEGHSTIRPLIGGILLAFPVALKVTPALPVCVLLVRLFSDVLREGPSSPSKRRFTHGLAGVAVGMMLFFLLVPAMAVGWTNNLKHLETWYVRVGSNEQVGTVNQFNVHSVRNQSLSNAVYRLGNWIGYRMAEGPDERIADDLSRAGESLPMKAPWVGHMVTGIRAVLVVLLLLVAVRWRPGTLLGQVAVFSLACAMTLPLSPISWGHHFTIFLPAALFLPLAVDVQGYHRSARALAVTAAGLLLVHYLSMELAGGIAGRLGMLGIGMMFWCAAVSLLFLMPASLRSRTARESGTDPHLSLR